MRTRLPLAIKIQAWVPYAILGRLDAKADRLGVPRSAVIRRALVAFLLPREQMQADAAPTSPACRPRSPNGGSIE